MKILSITAQKPHSTGSGTYLTELVKSFDRAGHKQAVVAGVYADDEVCFPNNVDFYPVIFGKDINYNIVGMSDVMPYPSTRYAEMDAKMISEFEEAFIKVIAEAIDKLNPDIILCHHLFLLTAMARKHFPNATIYGICHGSDLRQFINCKDLANLVKPEIQKLDHIFALHDEQAENISNMCDIDPMRISVIGCGYNSELFNANDKTVRNINDPVKVCYAGKMSSAKGIPELLNVIEQINQDKSYYAEYYLAGGCQEKSILNKLENLPTNVHYLGQLAQSELAGLFKSCDIFILPSYYEGLGLVLIEAMASGLIPISTNLPGIKDWIDKNVINPNVKYIPMPEMAGVDFPTESGRVDFINNMKNILCDTITNVSNSITTTDIPNTNQITWDKVSEKISNL